MAELSVRIIAFSKEQCPFDKDHAHTWQEWHSFRNSVLDILARYGSVGPMGKLPILDSFEESENEWHLATSNPDFFVVDDDMYGNSVRVEASCVLLKPPLLDELFMLLAPLRDWSVYLALMKGGLWVFRDRVCLKGTFLRTAVSVADLYRRCALGANALGRNC
jgi:hypothetical protein